MKFDIAYSRESFVKFLEVDFLPQDFIQETSLINITHKTTSKTTYIQEVTKLGVCESLDLIIYEVKHSGKNDPRVGLSKESFKILAQEWQGKALIAFVPMDNSSNYRFSYISIDLDLTAEGKVKKSFSNPRRYSYYLGKGISYYTPNKYLNSGRVKDSKDLQDRFSVEVLTKAFYNELSDWYAWAVKVVRFPNDLDDKTDDDKYNHEAVIRLVTRLIFVWFLKQKKLIPTEFFDEQYIAANLMYGFNPHANTTLFGKSNDSKYYKAILQNLFFAMLNSPITSTKGEMERRFVKEAVNGKTSDFDNKKLMRYKSMFSNPDHFVEIANRGVPFLNGGLFDCLDDRGKNNFVDGFSDDQKINNSLTVPDYLFFGEEVGKDIDLSEFYGDKKKKKVSARGVIDILKRYNFTVEENTPFDQEVSLDPELLGKVFENLLAMYNPETKATARKQTGSFYTPREIVQYMVDESLIAHLKRTVGDELEEEYRKLMCYTDEDTNLDDEQKRAVINSLHDCKILDPACGSGAFPMGVLQQMVHILSRLDGTNEIWKEILLDDAANETRTALNYSSKEERKEAMDDIERSFDESVNRPDYARKLYIIEKCIYGVDIQSIAIQISKLRFFISLVIDQIRNDNPKDNFGIRPLPNLEAKFVAANTLIGLDKSNGSLFETPAIKAKEEELKVANHKIFGTKTFKTKTKYRERVKELRSELSDMLLRMGYVSDDTAQLLNGWDMFNQNASSPFFDPEWMFGVNGGFDIVIGNPPYGVSIKGNYRANVESHLGKIPDYEIYYYFIEIARELSSDTGILSYIIPNTYLFNTFAAKYRLKLLTEWNMIEVLDCTKFPIFEKATVLNTINTWQRGSAKYVGYRNTTKVTNFEELIKRDRLSIDIDSLSEMNKNWGLAFSLDNNTIRVINNIRSNTTPLLDLFPMVSQGLIAYDKYKGQSAEIIKSRAYHHTEYKDGYKKWLFGEDVTRYNVKWNQSEYIDYCDGIANPRNPEFFRGKRILIREITNPSIFAGLTNDELYNDPSVIVILDNDLYSTEVLLAILNSKLATFYHFNSSPKATKGAFPKILVQDIKEFPLPTISKNESIVIETLVEFILYINKSEDQVNEYANNQALRSVIEGVIDSIIYELYFKAILDELNLNVLSVLKEDLKSVSRFGAKEQINVLFDTWNDYSGEYRNKMLLMPVKCVEVETITKYKK